MRSISLVIFLVAVVVAGCSGQKTFQPSATSSGVSAPTSNESIKSSQLPAVKNTTLACPVGAIIGKVNKWSRPGSHPYVGTAGYAISLFTVPKSVKRAWKKLIREKRSTKVKLKPGDRFCSMVYSARGFHHKWDNVEVSGDWTTTGEKPAGSDVYSVKEDGFIYELVNPHICNNWSYRVRRELVSSTPPLALKKTSSDSPFKLVVRVLDLDTAPAGFRKRFDEINSLESDATYPFEDGSVSRDLGSEITKLIDGGKGPLKYVKEGRCFKARLLLPGQKWGEPQEICGDHGILYWSKTVSQNTAMESNSQFGIELLSPPKGCQIRYPRKNQQGQHLIDTRLNDGGLASELAISAAKKGNPGFNLNTFAMKCGNGI